MVTEITAESRTSITMFIQCGWGVHIYNLSSRSLLTVVQCLKYAMKCTDLVTYETWKKHVCLKKVNQSGIINKRLSVLKSFASYCSLHNLLQFRSRQETVSFGGQNLDIRLTWDCGPAG